VARDKFEVKNEIIKSLELLIEHYSKNLNAVINSEKFMTSTRPSLNLLTLKALTSLSELIIHPEISDKIALNKIENLIQSVQYNHKQTTPVEASFFKIFTLGKIASWTRRASGEPASGITLCFGGTGHINHLEGEAHCEVANNYDSSIANKTLLNSYTYNIPGVASDPDGLYDPDVLGVQGVITGRTPVYPSLLPVALVKGQKSIAGNGCVEGVKDAFEYIKKLIEKGDIADDAVITILGHSRGAVQSLLLTQLLMNHPDLMGNRTLKVVAHDPVRGKLIPPGHFSIGEETFDVDALLYKPKPENAPLAQITIPIAMSDLRHDEFPIIDTHLFQERMGEGIVTVEPHPGFHNCALMPSANVNSMVISNKFEENYFSNLWFRRNYAGDTLEREEKMDALNRDYKFLLNNYYLLDDKKQLSEEAKKKCIEIYSRWISGNYEKTLINPGFHAAVTQQPRFINKQHLSNFSGLFYNLHHEVLVKSIAPEFYEAVETLFQKEPVDKKDLTDLIENLSEDGLASFRTLPMSFQTLASTITTKNILDNKKIQEETSSSVLNKEGTGESMGIAFVRDLVLFPEEHAKKTAKISYQRFAGIAEPINAATTLANMANALTDIQSHPKSGNDDKFNLAIKAAANKFLHHCDDSRHEDPKTRLQYFLMKEYCLYLDNKLTNTKIRQEDSQAISRLRSNIDLVTNALNHILLIEDPNEQYRLITDTVIPRLKTGSQLGVSTLVSALLRGIESYQKSSPSLEVKQAITNLDLLITNSPISLSRFSLDDNNKLTTNLFFATNNTQRLKNYLQTICIKVSNLNHEELKTPLNMSLRISLQNFMHLQTPSVLDALGFNLDLRSPGLNLARLGHYNEANHFHKDLLDNKLPKINYNARTGHYTAPDDDKAHQHGEEAARIFISTQIERFKGLINWLFAKVGIHIFETARYSEHDYLDSDIYAHDTPIDPDTNKAIHYWIGHASNFLVIPTPNGKPLHVLTDPFEGDMAPVIYPRMTKEGKLIDGEGDKRLPKVDVVIMSHNHRDHHSEKTLQRLLKQNPKMIVPQGDIKLFTDMGFTDVVELEAWEEATIKEGDVELLRISSVPARHWSGRGLTDAHQSAFNGYVLQSKAMEGDIYFAGDTAFMDDINVNPLFAKFNIKTSIQPGGPDERREDMESTHQSSADGIWMHFKMLAAHYEKMKAENEGINPSMEDFLERIKQVKTIYNHTATFKLGNLRLKDTFFSYQRVVGAFKESDEWQNIHLPTHEKNAYQGILALSQGMVFDDDNKKLTKENIVELIQSSVIIPKIGQRQALYSTEEDGLTQSFQHRSLITNRRSLIEFDTLMKDHINQEKNGSIRPSEIVIKLLDAYHSPWHAFFSRTFEKRNLQRYRNMISDCENDPNRLLHCLGQMEQDLGKRNLHGHMQSLVHYAKWVVLFNQKHQENCLDKFKEYFDCQQVRKLVDQEIHNSGWILSGPDRSQKQEAFMNLSDQLAKTPQDKGNYQKVLDKWLKTKANANADQTNDQMLSAHRYGKAGITHSKEVVNKIENIVGKYNFFSSDEKQSSNDKIETKSSKPSKN
jgi:L-ascorbate metabolism protein UlaG (beta-lactamase superfamily)